VAGDITTAEGRSRLKPQRNPYWRKLGHGQAIGFRKMTPQSAGTWLVQHYDGVKQTRKSLGAFDGPEKDRYTRAVKAAHEWLSHITAGGSLEAVTVAECCRRYVQHLRDERRGDTADDSDARFERWIYGDRALADVVLPKLSDRVVRAWRKRLAAAAVVINPHGEEKRTRARAAGTINRDMTALRAALNYGRDCTWVVSDVAWRTALAPIQGADGRRRVYLDPTQRQHLIEAAGAELGRFLRGLAMVPLRPGALAALTVGQFDHRQHLLVVGKDKAGADRVIMLPSNIASFFAACAQDAAGESRPVAEPLLARTVDGKVVAWNKDAWKKPMRTAAAAAELPAATVAYTLRHSAITDLVTLGLPLLTIAQLSGTSIAMIEKHYGHLQAKLAADAMSKLFLGPAMLTPQAAATGIPPAAADAPRTAEPTLRRVA
jgi:site-specific recombinase XerD